jgi:hypothetical protein
MTAEWGKDHAKSLVSWLKPDLVLIAFGMNDFWSYSQDQFRQNTQAIIDEVRRENPNCEFILVASMKFDPAYTVEPMYVSKLPDYAEELNSLTQPGVALLDMTTLSDALYAVKSAKDLETDPMHPDDFLARWYAQSLVAMFDPEERTKPIQPQSRLPRTFAVDPGGNDASPGTAGKPWKTLARLGQQNLVPGDHVILASGARFEGNIALHETDAGTPNRPIVVESLGQPATIVAKDQVGFTAYRGGLVLKNLHFEGAATQKKHSQNGILLSAKGGVEQRFVRIENVAITGFGGDALSIRSQKGSAVGFEDLILSHVQANRNYGTGIISEVGIAFENKGYAHRNFRIIDCDVSDNRSGSGLILSGVDHALVEYCKSFNNLGAGGGVGMWAWCARDVTFRYCIASGTRTNNGGDGGGFDLDGGCTGCVVENCLSYNNDGPGYMHCDYPGAPRTYKNVIQSSVSTDDGRKPKGDSLGFGFVSWGSGLDECSIDHDLAIVTNGDPKARLNGAFFVSFITGSKAAQDVLHVKNCQVRDSVADLQGPGNAFVRSDLPSPGPSDVRFSQNLFQGNSATPFVQAFSASKIYPTLSAWQSATGGPQPNRPPMTNSQLEVRRKFLLQTYKSLSPPRPPQSVPENRILKSLFLPQAS